MLPKDNVMFYAPKKKKSVWGFANSIGNNEKDHK